MAHRKKVPLQFNLMLAGHSRTGRTDFISTLVETLEISHLHQNKGSETQILFPTDVFKPTESTCIIECEDPFQYQKILLKLIDSPGLDDIPSRIHKFHPSAYEGLELRADEYADMLLVYIEGQYDEILKEQTKIRRNVKKIDHEVHACLYFLNPDTILSSKGLTIMDKIVLEKLCERDLITVRDLIQIQEYLRNDLSEFPIYDFFDENEDIEDPDYVDLKNMIPFCLVNSEELFHDDETGLRSMGIMIKDKKILGRKYIWGFIEVENPEHCDFNTLTTALLGSHIDELRNFTKDVLYEKYRTEKLKKKRASLFVPRNLQKLVFDLNLTEK